jgi:hypothetical protein
MFKWAASEQLVEVAVYQVLTTVAGLRKGRTEARETDPILPVDDATVEATLPHLPAVVADMVRLQRPTGYRPSDLYIRPKSSELGAGKRAGCGGVWRRAAPALWLSPTGVVGLSCGHGWELSEVGRGGGPEHPDSGFKACTSTAHGPA